MGDVISGQVGHNVSSTKRVQSYTLNAVIQATKTPNPSAEAAEWWVVNISLITHICGVRYDLNLRCQMFGSEAKADDFINEIMLNVYKGSCNV
jgi:hypothetical protein